MATRCFLAICAVLLAPLVAFAAEYRVEPIKQPPADVSPEIVARLSGSGYKVIEGAKRVVCEIWPAKSWAVKAGFQPSDTVIYPLEPGSLVGVLRFARKGADFRGQDIPSGVYTMRYANQPVDGNHVGTFPTRDFLLLLPASTDESAAPLAEKDLFAASAKSAESTHPAIMPLIKSEQPAGGTIRHLEEQDWWTLTVPGQDAKGSKLALEVIVVGKAAE
jgi:hypothetical protein